MRVCVVFLQKLYGAFKATVIVFVRDPWGTRKSRGLPLPCLSKKLKKNASGFIFVSLGVSESRMY